jgi:hypothetical protein
LLIIDTFFWWSYFALPHHMDHKECALANLSYDLVIECKIIRVRFGRFYLLIVDIFFLLKMLKHLLT